MQTNLSVNRESVIRRRSCCWWAPKTGCALRSSADRQFASQLVPSNFSYSITNQRQRFGIILYLDTALCNNPLHGPLGVNSMLYFDVTEKWNGCSSAHDQVDRTRWCLAAFRSSSWQNLDVCVIGCRNFTTALDCKIRDSRNRKGVPKKAA